MTVLTFLGVTIDATGASAPAFEDILDTLTSGYDAIYGADSYLGNDAQDLQLINTFARGINDANMGVMAAYNARSPATAQGPGLSAVIKINGMLRDVSGFSTMPLAIVGQANQPISNGTVTDANNNVWALPTSVTIPGSGTITVTATCTVAGAIQATAGVVTISTPSFGWQTATFTGTVTLGAPVETDAACRIRQSVSTSLPAQTIVDSISASIGQIQGVTRIRAYENTGDATDGNGMAAGSTQFLVEGGVTATIINAIGLKINPGAILIGSTTQTYTSPGGSTKAVGFNRPTAANISFALSLTVYSGWDSTTMEAAITTALAAYVNAIQIGGEVDYSLIPENARNTQFARYYKLTAWTLTKNTGSPAAADIILAYNESAVFNAVSFTVTGP